MFPQSDNPVIFVWNKAVRLFHTWYTDYFYVIEIDENHINDGWATKNKDTNTFEFNGSLHDYAEVHHFYGSDVIFVVHGIRPPLKLNHFKKYFKPPENPDELMALDGVLARVKLNNGNLINMIRASKHADIVMYGVIVAALCGIVLVALGLDLIHAPIMNEMQRNFAVVINQTR